MQEFSVCLDCRDHARRDVITAHQPPDFGRDACPSAVREFSQQSAVEAGVESQTSGNRQYNLPVRHGDVEAFVQAVISDPSNPYGDMTGDGVVIGLDVAPFVDAVIAGGVQPAPEPTALTLAIWSLLSVAAGFGVWRRRRER